MTLHTAPVDTTAELRIIKQLAHDIWHHHYTPIIGTAQVAYMLHKIYGLESLTHQISVENHRFFMIYINNLPQGFASIHEKEKGHFFLNKFYIHQSIQAKGFGTKVLNLLIINYLDNPQTLRLTVNRMNYKSINFYFKNDFVIESTADFDIGDGYFMNDFVMLRNFSN